MGVVDDVRDGLRENDTPDTYAVSETYRENGTYVGTISPETLRKLIEAHPDACRGFKMVARAGYEDPSDVDGAYSRAEHAGRIEIGSDQIINDLASKPWSCQVRLDTSNPQLVKATNESARRQIEIDDAVARLVPSTNDH